MEQSNATLDLSRGSEVETSKAAFAKVVLSGFKDRDVILDIIRRDEIGVTLKELALVMGKEKNQISGRISELLKAGKIFPCAVRDGFRIYKKTYQKTCRECGELIWKSGLCASCYGTLRDEELKARDYENGKCEDCDKGESNV